MMPLIFCEGICMPVVGAGPLHGEQSRQVDDQGVERRVEMG
jgi:hypothetical protein